MDKHNTLSPAILHCKNGLLTTTASWHTSAGLLTQLMPSPRHWDGCCTVAMSRASWNTWEQSIPTL
eukprot:5506729-Ditylum_brightwellii.AAC.1